MPTRRRSLRYDGRCRVECIPKETACFDSLSLWSIYYLFEWPEIGSAQLDFPSFPALSKVSAAFFKPTSSSVFLVGEPESVSQPSSS